MSRWQRLGERNGRAALTAYEVELIRSLREDEVVTPGQPRFWTYARLAEKFEISVRQVGNIVNYHHWHGVEE